MILYDLVAAAVYGAVDCTVSYNSNVGSDFGDGSESQKDGASVY